MGNDHGDIYILTACQNLSYSARMAGIPQLQPGSIGVAPVYGHAGQAHGLDVGEVDLMYRQGPSSGAGMVRKPAKDEPVDSESRAVGISRRFAHRPRRSAVTWDPSLNVGNHRVRRYAGRNSTPQGDGPQARLTGEHRNRQFRLDAMRAGISLPGQ